MYHEMSSKHITDADKIIGSKAVISAVKLAFVVINDCSTQSKALFCRGVSIYLVLGQITAIRARISYIMNVFF